MVVLKINNKIKDENVVDDNYLIEEIKSSVLSLIDLIDDGEVEVFYDFDDNPYVKINVKRNGNLLYTAKNYSNDFIYNLYECIETIETSIMYNGDLINCFNEFDKMNNKYSSFINKKNKFEQLQNHISILRNSVVNRNDYENIVDYKNALSSFRKSLFILQKEAKLLFLDIVDNYSDVNDYVDEIEIGQKKIILK